MHINLLAWAICTLRTTLSGHSGLSLLSTLSSHDTLTVFGQRQIGLEIGGGYASPRLIRVKSNCYLVASGLSCV